MRKFTLLLAVLLLLTTGLIPAIAQDEEGESTGSAVTFNVIAADIEAANGVVHVIDAVLVPPTLELGAMDEEMDAEATEEPAEEMDAEATEEPAEDMGDMAEATEEPAEDGDMAEATEEATEEETLPTIAEIVATSEVHTVLLAAVTEAGLVEALSGDGPFTVFAPTDEAFTAALDALGITAEELLADTDTLTEILGFHVIPGAALTAADLAELSSYETLSGVTVDLGVGEEAVAAGMGEPTMDEDMEEAADDGEMGTIVDVAVSTEGFSTLVAAVEAAGLVEILSGEGPFTVFAPTDEAFAAALEALDLTAEELLADTELLTSVLTYHVVEGEVLAEAVVELDGEDVETVNGATVAISVDGETVMVNDATVTAVDVMASNGVIHVIDTVLLPPAGEEDMDEDMDAEAEATEEMTDDGEAAEATEPGTIVDVAASTEGFSTLVAAVEAAGLVEILSGEGPFTVFAPTDEAFAAALEALDLTAEELLADTELLTSVLTYHVVAGEVLAEAVVELDGEDVETVNGATVAISVDGETVMVNDATVTAVDVMASNGVIHVIDTVLLPPAGEEEE